MNKLIPEEYRDSYFRFRNKKRDYNATVIMGILAVAFILVLVVPTF